MSLHVSRNHGKKYFINRCENKYGVGTLSHTVQPKMQNKSSILAKAGLRYGNQGIYFKTITGTTDSVTKANKYGPQRKILTTMKN